MKKHLPFIGCCLLAVVILAGWLYAMAQLQPLDEVSRAIQICEVTGGQVRLVRYTKATGIELNCIYGDEPFYDEGSGQLLQPL